MSDETSATVADFAVATDDGEVVGSVRLDGAAATLRDARRTIDEDGVPVPADFRFVLANGAPVSSTQEGSRLVRDSLSSGGDGGGGTEALTVKAGPLEDLRRSLGPLSHLDDVLIAEQAERFVDGTRRWLFERFDGWISSSGPSSSRHRVFVLTADAGVGKTGIACKLARDRGGGGGGVVARHFCRHDDSRRSDPKNMLLSIAYQLAERFPEYLRRVASHLKRRGLTRSVLMGEEYTVAAVFSELFQNLLRGLAVDDEGRRYVILIDAIDECVRGARNDILECIRKHFDQLPEWLNVFITTRPEVPITEKLKVFNPVEIRPEEEENIADLRIFFRKVLGDEGILSDCSETERERAIELLVRKSRGLFVYASMAAETIRSREKGSITMGSIEAFPEGLEGFYQEQMERTFDDTENSLPWTMIKHLVVAAEPLHVLFLENVTMCGVGARKGAIKTLSRFFPVRDRFVHSYHKSLKDWLVREDRADSTYHVNVVEAEAALARGCLRIIQESGILSGGQAGVMPVIRNWDSVRYALRHGVSHLCSAGMRKEARRHVLDVGWLMTKAMDGDGARIVADCQMLEEGDRVVELVRRAVGLSFFALTVDPRQLASQLVGRLLGVAAKTSGEDESVRAEVHGIIERLKLFDYGFSWWCPVSPTWDQANAPCVRTLIGHSRGIDSVAWSRDGRLVASGARDGTVRIWDATRGECTQVFRGSIARAMQGHVEWVGSVAWSPCDDRIACGFANGSIRIWNAVSGESVTVLCKSYSPVKALGWSANGRQIASGMLEGSIHIWNVGTAQCERVLKGHRSYVATVTWVHDGTDRFMSGSGDNSVFLWDSLSWKCLLKVSGHPGFDTSVAFSQDGMLAVSGFGDNTARIWEVSTGKELRVLQGQHSGTVRSLAWSHSSQLVATGSADDSIGIWESTSGACLQVLRGHTSSVRSLVWSRNDAMLLSGSVDNTARIWDATVHCRDVTFDGHKTKICCVAWCHDGTLVASGSRDDILIWDVNLGKSTFLLEGHESFVTLLEFSHDGKLLSSFSWDNTIRIWNAANGECLHILEGHRSFATCSAWSRDGKRLASGSDDETARVWDTHAGVCLSVLRGHTIEVKTLAWSPDGQRIVSGGGDNTIRIWDPTVGDCLAVLSGHSSFVNSVDWSRDGRFIASGSWDGTVRLWSAEAADCVSVFASHSSYVTMVAWSPDGVQVISNSDDGTLRIWNAESGECTDILDRCSDLSSIPFDPYSTSVIEQHLCALAATGSPVGIDFDRVQSFANKACGISDYTVSFFTLLEQTGRKVEKENRIVFLQSDPLVMNFDGDLEVVPRLEYAKEKSLLCQSLREASRDIDLSFKAATTSSFQVALVTQVECVHFSGHGAPTYLLLEDGRGGAHFLSDKDLFELYQPSTASLQHSPPHELVFISACHSGLLAHIFVNAGVSHVVCCEHDSVVADDAANVFTRSFYMSLAVGHTVRTSFEIGRQAVASGPFVLNPSEEKEKFVLLPHDNAHNERVLHARRVDQWCLNETCIKSMPSLMHAPNERDVESRQMDMYLLMNKILTSRLIFLVGNAESERRQVARATCHYIFSRRDTPEVGIKGVFYLSADWMKQMVVALEKLDTQLASAADKDLDVTLDTLCALERMKALIFIDSICPEDDENAYTFLAHIFQVTSEVKVLIIAEEPVDVSSFLRMDNQEVHFLK